MLKTITYTITAPDEAPEMPEHFRLTGYAVSEQPNYYRRFPTGELWYARATWVERGHERCEMEACAESVLLPDGGSFEIFCQWDQSKRQWGEWLDIGDGQAFDFDELKEAMAEATGELSKENNQ